MLVQRLALAAAFVAASFAAVAPVRAQELTLSSWVPPSHMIVKDIMMPWAEQVEKATAGRVKVKLLPKSVTNAVNHFDAVRDGLADIVFISHSYTPARFTLVRIGVLPFSGDNAEVNSVALWRIYDRHFAKFNEHAGTKVLTIYTHGPGIPWNTKKAIAKIEDFQGMKFRVGGGMAADVGNALGVNVIAKPAPESYELLSSGVVDGVFFPGESIASFKLDKLIKHATVVPNGLYSDSHAVLMNLDRFNKLSKADQDAINKVSGEAFARLAGQAWDRNARTGFEAMKASGGTVTVADPALVKAIAERTAKFEQDVVKDISARGLDGAKILAEYRNELKTLGGR